MWTLTICCFEKVCRCLGWWVGDHFVRINSFSIFLSIVCVLIWCFFQNIDYYYYYWNYDFHTFTLSTLQIFRYFQCGAPYGDIQPHMHLHREKHNERERRGGEGKTTKERVRETKRKNVIEKEKYEFMAVVTQCHKNKPNPLRIYLVLKTGWMCGFHVSSIIIIILIFSRRMFHSNFIICFSC